MKFRTKDEQKAFLDGFESCAKCIANDLSDVGKKKLECLLMVVRNAVRDAVKIEDIEQQESEDKAGGLRLRWQKEKAKLDAERIGEE
jgi:hypothetical protein